jgi:SAM-dependent methyltransferase
MSTTGPCHEKAAPRVNEIEKVCLRYERRKRVLDPSLYSPLNPDVYMGTQERERALIRWIKRCNIAPVAEKRVLEVGCGTGNTLLTLIRLGFRPENLVGNELLLERARNARHRLPSATQILEGDASELPLEDEQFDVVYQSMVFSSLLDNAFQRKLADRMWALVKPGGGILWYDFTYRNPNNPDVRAMPVGRVRQLFPKGQQQIWRLTLAPPVSRRVTRVHPCLYTLFNALPFLRTHVLCWILKGREERVTGS